MKQRLIIDNVDFDLLEKQRKILNKAFYTGNVQQAKPLKALRGILNMLDSWSDNRFYEKDGGK